MSAPQFTDSEIRICDAERSAMAERLSQHFADGRLDRFEFDERVDRALKAKTRGDLAGLFAGLPGAIDRAPIDRSPVGPSRRPTWHRAVVLFIVIVVTAAIGQSLLQPHVPWLLLGVAAFLFLRHRHHRPRRR